MTDDNTTLLLLLPESIEYFRIYGKSDLKQLNQQAHHYNDTIGLQNFQPVKPRLVYIIPCFRPINSIGHLTELVNNTTTSSIACETQFRRIE
jgi:hypothetical protein